MSDETATEKAMKSWHEKPPNHPHSGANLSHDAVERLAAEENYPYLFNSIQWYKSSSSVTWEMAMQLAATELSRVVKQQQAELMRLVSLMPRQPIIVPKESDGD